MKILSNLFPRKMDISAYAGFRIMHGIRGIDRVRCAPHFKELVDAAWDAGAWNAVFLSDSFWLPVTSEDIRKHKAEIVCETCSGAQPTIELIKP